VPGGGISLDGERWVPCKPGFFLPVRVLSRLFRRLFLQYLDAAFVTGELAFFTDLAGLTEPEAFAAYLAPLRKGEWVVYAKRPFAGPKQVLTYLARYTHRVAIANSRLISLSDGNVSFRWKDYRQDGKPKSMMLTAGEFMRRFLLHTLPDGFHRIRHYGLFANGHRASKIELSRKLLAAPSAPVNRDGDDHDKATANTEPPPCPCCGGRMKIIETLEGAYASGARSARRQCLKRRLLGEGSRYELRYSIKKMKIEYPTATHISGKKTTNAERLKPTNQSLELYAQNTPYHESNSAEKRNRIGMSETNQGTYSGSFGG